MTTSSVLSIKGLCWAPIGEMNLVVSDLSFQLYPGECVGLVGPSGCGKSSILRCIVHLEPIQNGSILWKGKEISPDNICSFRRSVAYIQQVPTALAQSIGDNLAFARGPNGMTHIQQLQMLQHLGLSELDEGKRFGHLSIGEQQRLALVRSLSPLPEVLLLDEPTSALDPENERLVEDVICHYLQENPQRAAIWISHQPAQRERIFSRSIDLNPIDEALS